MLTDRDSMLARRYGRLIMIGAGLVLALSILRLIRRTYVAVVLPLSVIVGGAVTIAGILGQLLDTTPDESPDRS